MGDERSTSLISLGELGLKLLLLSPGLFNSLRIFPCVTICHLDPNGGSTTYYLGCELVMGQGGGSLPFSLSVSRRRKKISCTEVEVSPYDSGRTRTGRRKPAPRLQERFSPHQPRTNAHVTGLRLTPETSLRVVDTSKAFNRETEVGKDL